VTDLQKEKLGNFALKRLKDQSRADLFYREMEVIQRLQHPNVIRVEDIGTTGDRPYYVMEYCEGGSLERVGGSALRGDFDKAVGILDPICSAVSAVHRQGVIHRDLKPSNILLRADGTPVLSDFGMCHLEYRRRAGYRCA
jgi:eukaryotic-like serine/threonine-protein kinase